jgi:hypothetical protein
MRARTAAFSSRGRSQASRACSRSTVAGVRRLVQRSARGLQFPRRFAVLLRVHAGSLKAPRPCTQGRGGERGLLVQFGKTPASQVGNRGSTPRRSTDSTGPSSNGKIPVWHAGDPGSSPGGSTDTEGSRITVGRAVLERRFSPPGEEGSTPSPSAHAPMVKRTSCLASNEALRVRFLLGVLSRPVVQRPGRPLDMGKTGGSSPPGTTDCRRGSRTGGGGRLLSGWTEHGLAGSTPAPSAGLMVSVVYRCCTRRCERRGGGFDSPLTPCKQECAPGRAGGLQNRSTRFDSLRSC